MTAAMLWRHRWFVCLFIDSGGGNFQTWNFNWLRLTESSEKSRQSRKMLRPLCNKQSFIAPGASSLLIVPVRVKTNSPYHWVPVPVHVTEPHWAVDTVLQRELHDKLLLPGVALSGNLCHLDTPVESTKLKLGGEKEYMGYCLINKMWVWWWVGRGLLMVSPAILDVFQQSRHCYNATFLYNVEDILRRRYRRAWV